jgi:periplasmic divalent cation tolerance protein
MIIFYVPCKNKAEAKTIAKTLLEKKLIACANVLPIDSMYYWEGKFKENKEVVLLLKTLNHVEEEVKQEIKELHSYEVPAIIRINTRVNSEYLAWAEEQVE